MAAGAQAFRDRQRVVVDPAALIAREHDNALGSFRREIPPALRERAPQALRDALAREVRDVAAALLDELAPQRRVTDDTLEGGRDGARRLVLEEDAGLAERLGDRASGVRDDRQIAAHRLEQRNAEALV